MSDTITAIIEHIGNTLSDIPSPSDYYRPEEV